MKYAIKYAIKYKSILGVAFLSNLNLAVTAQVSNNINVGFTHSSAYVEDGSVTIDDSIGIASINTSVSNFDIAVDYLFGLEDTYNEVNFSIFFNQSLQEIDLSIGYIYYNYFNQQKDINELEVSFTRELSSNLSLYLAGVHGIKSNTVLLELGYNFDIYNEGNLTLSNYGLITGVTNQSSSFNHYQFGLELGYTINNNLELAGSLNRSFILDNLDKTEKPKTWVDLGFSYSWD